MESEIIQQVGKGSLGSILVIMAMLITLVYKILKDQNNINEKREQRLSKIISSNQEIIIGLTEKISVVEEVREEVRKQGDKLDRIDGDIKEIKNKM